MSATVLVVDDEPDVAHIYARQLSSAYDVRVANGGREALEIVNDEVDVVLLDRNMPDVSGDEVLDRIRETDYDCRVAMVTAVDADFDIVDLGFDEYVTKPVSGEELCDTVERLLVRATFSETVQRFYSLVAARSALEAEKMQAELDRSPEYEALTTRIDALRANLADAEPAPDDDREWRGLLHDVLDERRIQ